MKKPDRVVRFVESRAIVRRPDGSVQKPVATDGDARWGMMGSERESSKVKLCASHAPAGW